MTCSATVPHHPKHPNLNEELRYLFWLGRNNMTKTYICDSVKLYKMFNFLEIKKLLSTEIIYIIFRSQERIYILRYQKSENHCHVLCWQYTKLLDLIYFVLLPLPHLVCLLSRTLTLWPKA